MSKVELQVQALRVETARADSVRAVALDSLRVALAALDRAVAQAIADQQRFLNVLRGELRGDFLAVQEQLVQIQELTGANQRQLNELRGRLDRAREALASDSLEIGEGAGASEIFNVSLEQLRRGSVLTARAGFQEFLRRYPDDERTSDALFYVGETFERESPDSAMVVFERVAQEYRNSKRAPHALYKLSLLAEQRGDQTEACLYLQRLIRGYPRSDEAPLAREKFQQCGR